MVEIIIFQCEGICVGRVGLFFCSPLYEALKVNFCDSDVSLCEGILFESIAISDWLYYVHFNQSDVVLLSNLQNLEEKDK